MAPLPVAALFRLACVTPPGGEPLTDLSAPAAAPPTGAARSTGYDVNDVPGIPEVLDLSALLRAVAAEISGRGKAISAGIRSDYAARIAAAARSGLSRQQITAVIASLKQAMQATLSAAAERMAVELGGAVAATAAGQRGRGRRSVKRDLRPKV